MTTPKKKNSSPSWIRRHKRFVLGLVILAMVILSWNILGFQVHAFELQRLEQAYEQWQAQGITDYEMTLRIGNSLAFPEYHLRVSGNDITLLDESIPLGNLDEQALTIEGLFNSARMILSDKPTIYITLGMQPSITMQFDETYHFLSSLRQDICNGDWFSTLVDHCTGSAFWVTHFEPLP